MTETFYIPAAMGILESRDLLTCPTPVPEIPFCLSGTISDGVIHTLCPFRFLPDATLSEAANRVVVERLREELTAYFRGELRHFSVPIAEEGTPYQRSVWSALRQIPYGQSRTYGEIAVQLGYMAPVAARAVGNACGRNPVLLLTPCHRVFAKGSIGGFSGAPELKRWLCELEGIAVPGEKQ